MLTFESMTAKRNAPVVTGEKKRQSPFTDRLLVRVDPRVDIKEVGKAIDGLVLERLRVIVVEAPGVQRVRRMAAGRNSPFLAVEPERRIHALAPGGPGSGSGRQGSSRSGGGLPFADSRVATWGIQAVNVLQSRFTGKGVRIAVLDTGFDFTHPDFAGRTIHRKSFVGRQAIDKDGHGTHCAGVASNRAFGEGCDRGGPCRSRPDEGLA